MRSLGGGIKRPTKDRSSIAALPRLKNRLNFLIDRNVSLGKTINQERRVRMASRSIAEMKKPADVIILIEEIENAFRLFARNSQRRYRHGFPEAARNCQVLFHHIW